MRDGGVPVNMAAQDKKLHQLDPPQRATLGSHAFSSGDDFAAMSGAGAGGVGAGAASSSSWDQTEVARQIALLTEERDFLRKYVSRCEHELKAYQLQYPDLVGGHTAGGQGELLNELSGSIEELPPWIGQAKYMSPLLVAYEARIEELTEKSAEQLHDFAALKSQYDDLFKRNSEAEAELESNIKNLLTHMDQQKGGGGARNANSAGPLDEDEASELHEQVALYKEQLDIVNSQKLELEGELAKAHGALGETRAERDAYWNGEVKKLQASIAALRMERDRFAHSSSNLNQTQLDLTALQKEHASLQKKFLAAQVQMENLERELESSMDKEKHASAGLLYAERDLESLLKTLQGMERDLDAAKAREVAAVKRESETLAKAESARLEKAQAQMREQNGARELARLEERLQFELSQAHKQAAEEIAALYERGKENEEKLANELANLSLVVAELEAQKEKLQRDNGAVKSQAEQLHASVQSELLGLKASLSSAQSQLSEMHLAAESGLAKLRRAEAELERAREFAAKEKAQLSESVHALKLKNESLTLANQNLSTQVQKLVDNVARVEREQAELRRTSDMAVARLQAQLLETEAARKAAVDDLKQRLEEAYRLHEQSEARSSELLASQDVLAAKWREENKHVRAHLGKLLTEEKTVTATLHQRIAEMEARVNQLVRERDQAMSFQTQYEQVSKRL